MPDKRCPMCGKPNPEDAETCKYCQARLKPLIKPAMPGATDPTRRRPPLTGRNASDLDSSLPEWLRDFRPSEGDSRDAAGPSEDQPDNEPGESPESGGEPEEQDWLSRIQSEEKPVSPQEPAEQALPEWLANLGTGGQPADTPGSTGEDKTESEPSEEPVENEPDWLKRIRARQRGEVPPEDEQPGGEEGAPGEPSPETPASPAELPDWLSNLGKPETLSPEQAAEEPDWSFLTEPQAPVPEDEAVPEWFAPLEDKREAGVSSEGPASPEESDEPVEAAGVTDKAAGSEPVAPFVEEDLITGLEEGAGAAPAASNLPLPDEEMPDWLKRLESTSSTSSAPEESVPAFMEDAVLPESAPEPEETAPEEPAPVLETPDLNTLPDWISQMPKEEAAIEETPGEVSPPPAGTSSETESLLPAELPSWLEAMRPVEAAAPPMIEDVSKAKMENAGPLAGLRGMLSAEQGAAAMQKPKAISVKLQITENQQAHMALMEELLKSEGVARPLAARPAVNTLYVMRILVALILLLAVLAPVWLNQNMTPMPKLDLIPSEVVDAGSLITGVPPGGLVLLAFDYEPGLSGEMDVPATTVIDQLMSRQAYMAIVSTNASGPLLAERMFSAITAKTGKPYASEANLGYVPGGASALLSLAENPRQVLPYDLHSANVWEGTPLASVNSLADFALVVVFTEKADTARGWIEQVQPTLSKNDTPLVMVVSAQAEPMVRPYYETTPQQVNGMISGLAGFAAFESITDQAGPARGYWDAYGAGMLVAAGLLLLGGLMYGGLAVFSPRKRPQGESVE